MTHPLPPGTCLRHKNGSCLTVIEHRPLGKGHWYSYLRVETLPPCIRTDGGPINPAQWQRITFTQFQTAYSEAGLELDALSELHNPNPQVF